MILVITGCHGVGKTTLGRALAREMRIPFDDEIGARLASDPLRRPAGVLPADPQLAFDESVFELELKRDAARGDTSRVVETWHPGNLAFAEHRSPTVVQRFRPLIEAVCRQREVVVVPMSAPREVLAARQHEPGDLSFFLSVGAAAERWASSLGLRCLQPVHSHQFHPQALAEQVIRGLHALDAPVPSHR